MGKSLLRLAPQLVEFDAVSRKCRASLVAQLVKNPPAVQEDLGLIPGLGRSPGEGNSYPFQYSGLENSMNCTAHGVAQSRT